ncbi:hypothetical protein HDE_03966 [Halotydeus destructor]|nr:hypothetical protein HDE_03966 [Halotydeus destructor]
MAVERLLILLYIGSSMQLSQLNCHGRINRVSSYSERVTNYTSHCSYLTLGNLLVDDSGSLLYSYDDLDNLKLMREKYPNVKRLIGLKENSTLTFCKMASDLTIMNSFLDSLADLVDGQELDGFLLNYYPVRFNASTIDASRTALTILLKSLRRHFGSDYIMAINGVDGDTSLPFPYDCQTLEQLVDFVELDTIGYVRNTNRKAHHAPLGPPGQQAKGPNVKATVDHWATNCPKLRSKLFLTIATYGVLQRFQYYNHDFVHADKLQYIPYNELCNHSSTWIPGWEAPVIEFRGQAYVSFDNHDSVKLKLDYASAKGLAGVAYYAFEFDVFSGPCWPQPGPLLSTIVEAIEYNKAEDVALSEPTPGNSGPTDSVTIEPTNRPSSSSGQPTDSLERPGTEPEELANHENWSSPESLPDELVSLKPIDGTTDEQSSEDDSSADPLTSPPTEPDVKTGQILVTEVTKVPRSESDESARGSTTVEMNGPADESSGQPTDNLEVSGTEPKELATLENWSCPECLPDELGPLEPTYGMTDEQSSQDASSADPLTSLSTELDVRTGETSGTEVTEVPTSKAFESAHGLTKVEMNGPADESSGQPTENVEVSGTEPEKLATLENRSCPECLPDEVVPLEPIDGTTDEQSSQDASSADQLTSPPTEPDVRTGQILVTEVTKVPRSKTDESEMNGPAGGPLSTVAHALFTSRPSGPSDVTTSETIGPASESTRIHPVQVNTSKALEFQSSTVSLTGSEWASSTHDLDHTLTTDEPTSLSALEDEVKVLSLTETTATGLLTTQATSEQPGPEISPEASPPNTEASASPLTTSAARALSTVVTKSKSTQMTSSETTSASTNQVGNTSGRQTEATTTVSFSPLTTPDTNAMPTTTESQPSRPVVVPVTTSPSTLETVTPKATSSLPTSQRPSIVTSPLTSPVTSSPTGHVTVTAITASPPTEASPTNASITVVNIEPTVITASDDSKLEIFIAVIALTSAITCITLIYKYMKRSQQQGSYFVRYDEDIDETAFTVTSITKDSNLITDAKKIV